MAPYCRRKCPVLDIFRKILHNKGIGNKLGAWTAFLSADEPELAEHIRFFRALQRCPKLRFIEIFNHFYSVQSDQQLRAEKEIPLRKTHIDQLTPVMLAELPEDTVLRILLYRKSW